MADSVHHQGDAASAAAAVSLRAMEYPRDLARTVAIFNTWSLEPTTVERVAEWEATHPPETRRYRTVAVNSSGEVIGYVEATHTPWSEQGRYKVELCVDPAWRGAVVGGAGVAASRGRDAGGDRATRQ